MKCDELSDLILFFAGGVAEEEESRRVLAHLAGGCPRCAGRLVESRACLAPLSLAIDPADPGPDVRKRLMTRIAAASVHPRAAVDVIERWGRGAGLEDPGRAAGDGDGQGRSLPSQEGPRVTSFHFPRSAQAPADRDAEEDRATDAGSRFVRTWVVPSLAAALAAAFAGLAVYTPMNRERLRIEARMAQQEGELRVLQSDVERAKRTIDLLRSPVVQVVSLRGAETPRGAGRILWDTSHRQWHFFAADLEPAGPGRTYQLWFITSDQRMISAGTFDVDASGQGELIASVPEGLAIVLAAVTDEPAGGMPQPTGKIHIKGEVPAAS